MSHIVRGFGIGARRDVSAKRWLLRPAPKTEALARLFCFPYAGGAASAFRLWPSGLPDELEVCAVQLPGRANRLREPTVASIPRLVEALVDALSPELDLPFAFFGHSMGALLASELARAFLSRGLPVPAHVFVSSRRPPRIPSTEKPLHLLPDGQFVEEINRRYGGIPPEIICERDVLELLLPSLRADIAALETFEPTEAVTLSCPLSAFGGASDALTPREHLEAWRHETTSSFRTRIFAGGHFYLNDARDEVLADISTTLGPMLGAARH